MAPFYNIKGELLNYTNMNEPPKMSLKQRFWNYILFTIKSILEFIIQLLILSVWWVAVFIIIIVYPIHKTIQLFHKGILYI